MKTLLCALALAPLALAGTRLLTFDARGALTGEAPAVLRTGGLALAPREALLGAARAVLVDEQGRLHPLLWIAGEDADAGVVEIFVGLQAPRGPDAATRMGQHVHSADHAATARAPFEAGGFGPIRRLDCGGARDRGGPLYDEHGLLAGWHAVRAVDGQRLAFAIPLERFNALSATLRLDLPAWNRRDDAAREPNYQRGLGYLWAADFDGALFYFRKAVEARPTHARAWFHLAFAEGKNGHGKARLECYRKAVELDPNYAPARYYLGFSLLLGGDRMGALVEHRRLKDLDEGWAARLKLFLDAAHVDVLDKPHEHREM
jgi:tetratricopeptide (TPR) repeat protein